MRSGLSQAGWASDREARPLTGRPGLSQGGQASQNEAWPLTGRPGPSQGGQASHSEARPLREARPHREAGLSQERLAYYREARGVTEGTFSSSVFCLFHCHHHTQHPEEKLIIQIMFLKDF